MEIAVGLARIYPSAGDSARLPIRHLTRLCIETSRRPIKT